MPESNLANYKDLLTEFKRLPPSPRDLTFMQVAGYSHYENVCSNILAFYLDPQEEHGLGDLVLRSLLEATGVQEIGSFEVVQIDPEYLTIRKQRIDLVIQTERFVIGIENKIYHWLANDLSHYGKVLDGIGKTNDSEVVKIVIGLHPIVRTLQGNFRSVTYPQLWKAVERNLGPIAARANQKWLNYLFDFIQTTRHLSKRNMELKPNNQFFIENNQAVNQLIQEYWQFRGRLNARVSELLGRLLARHKETPLPLMKEPWIWKKDCLVEMGSVCKS